MQPSGSGALLLGLGGSLRWNRLCLGRHGGVVVVIVGGSVVGGSVGGGGGIGVVYGSAVCVALFVDNLFIVANFMLLAKGRREGEEAMH